MSELRPGLAAVRDLARSAQGVREAGELLDRICASVAETFGFDSTPAPERQRSQRAEAWLRLTGNRTDDEVTELLLIVEQILRMRDMDGP